MKKSGLKFLAAMMAAALLGGCAAKDTVTEKVENAEAVMEETKTEAEEPVKEEAETAAPMQVVTRQFSQSYLSEDGNTEVLKLTYKKVSLTGDGYEKLAAGISQWSDEREQELKAVADEYAGYAKEDETISGYSVYQQVSPMRADSQVVSLMDEGYEYTGGAHPNHFRSGVNFDSKTGEILDLEDIITDMPGFQEEATACIIYSLKENYSDGLFENYEDTVRDMWQWDIQWYLDASGIVIVFNEYEVGPYAMGSAEVHLPYTDFAKYIKADYLPEDTTGIAKIAENSEVMVKLPGIDEEINMLLQTKSQEEYGSVAVSLWLGENEVEVGEFARVGKAYLIRTGDGQFYVVFDVDMASDDFTTYVYRITDGILEQTDQIDAAIESQNIGALHVDLSFVINMLGTRSSIVSYEINTDGKLETDQTEYTMNYGNAAPEPITTTTELPIVMDRLNGDSAGEEETVIPAGTKLLVTATDNQTYVKVSLMDSAETGTIAVERGTGEDSSRITINGMDESECFEMLPYAG